MTEIAGRVGARRRGCASEMPLNQQLVTSLMRPENLHDATTGHIDPVK